MCQSKSEWGQQGMMELSIGFAITQTWVQTLVSEPQSSQLHRVLIKGYSPD